MLDGALANAPLGATVTLSIEHGKGDNRVMQVPWRLSTMREKGLASGVFPLSDKSRLAACQGA